MLVWPALGKQSFGMVEGLETIQWRRRKRLA